MHYYPHNIPDFNNATRHLTRVERSVYRDAIERYYDTESPLPADDFGRLARVLLCATQEEKDALAFILDEFFDLSDAGYTHSRCDAEIEKYRLNSTAKARAGKASAEARKSRAQTPVEHVLNSVEQTNNQELITNNQEQETNKDLKDIAPQAAPATPKTNKSKSKPALKTFTEWSQEKQAAGEKLIPDNSSIFETAEKMGIPNDYLVLAWQVFKDYYTNDNQKKYADWRLVFCKAIKGDWLKLWSFNRDGQCYLTPKGKMHANAHGVASE